MPWIYVHWIERRALLSKTTLWDCSLPPFAIISAHEMMRCCSAWTCSPGFIQLLRVWSKVTPIALYKAWVERLSQREFADELVIVAVARELNVRLICVPHTPQQAPQPWAISTYYNTEVSTQNDCIILLANNDVHYMWLDRIQIDEPQNHSNSQPAQNPSIRSSPGQRVAGSSSQKLQQ